jgi:nitrite reductase/ring-hydroxylating ferredoxin subunit
MKPSAQPICESAALDEAGRGIRFEVTWGEETYPAFAIRFKGKVRAYLNRCGHIPVELDWNHGEFLDISKQFIVCATHGACYDPETGNCLGGPCNGNGLTPLAVMETGQQVFLEAENDIHLYSHA